MMGVSPPRRAWGRSNLGHLLCGATVKRWISPLKMEIFHGMLMEIYWDIYNHWLVVTGTLEFYMTFPSYWECHHPNGRTPSFFQRGRYTTNQINYGQKCDDLPIFFGWSSISDGILLDWMIHFHSVWIPNMGWISICNTLSSLHYLLTMAHMEKRWGYHDNMIYIHIHTYIDIDIDIDIDMNIDIDIDMSSTVVICVFLMIFVPGLVFPQLVGSYLGIVENPSYLG